MKRTVHAGKSSGPEGVRDAVEYLGADQIDHGVRAIEDNAVVQLLVERQIPLGVCPTSNLTLGLYERMQDHPIERLRLAGISVSVNTDDPVLLETDLPTEYARCASAFNWNADTFRKVAATSISASFAPAQLKEALLVRVAAWKGEQTM